MLMILNIVHISNSLMQNVSKNELYGKKTCLGGFRPDYEAIIKNVHVSFNIKFKLLIKIKKPKPMEFSGSNHSRHFPAHKC